MVDRLARWISVLFDSSVLSLPIFLALGYISAGILGLLWAVLVLIIVTGIPFAYLLIGSKHGWVSDLELSNSEERSNFILISMTSDLVALGLFQMGDGPHILQLIILTYLYLAIVMFTISIFWKISMHMAGIGGFATLLVFVFGAPALWAFLSLPLVAWAHLHRQKHSPAQLAAGAGVGIALTMFVFGTFDNALYS